MEMSSSLQLLQNICKPVFALRATPGTTLHPSGITWLRHA
jgi:hypothetical protein